MKKQKLFALISLLIGTSVLLSACTTGLDFLKELSTIGKVTESTNSVVSSDNTESTHVNRPSSSVKSSSSTEKVTASSKSTTSKTISSKSTTTVKPSSTSKVTVSTVSAQSKALANAKTKADKQLYLDAMNILKQYLATNANDTTVKRQLAVYEQKYAEQQVNKAEKEFTDYTKYENALKVIRAALQNIPEDSTLLERKEYYSSFMPVTINNLKISEQNNARLYDDCEDLLGNNHKNAIQDGYADNMGHIIFALNGKYNTINFTVFKTAMGAEGNVSVRDISNGDFDSSIMLYNYTNFKEGVQPFNVELDVTGIQLLRIWVDNFTVVSDAVLQRTAK